MSVNLTLCETTISSCEAITGLSASTIIANAGAYFYVPSLAMGLIFLSLYTLSTGIHLIQVCKGRPRWMCVMVIGGLIEILGWGGRIWSHFIYFGAGFIMQICCLVIAPTFISAALYMILGDLIRTVNPRASPISSKTFKIVFIVFDVISLVIQAIGGGLAATAQSSSSEKAGSNIMLAGIVIQLIIMIGFSAFAVVWWLRSTGVIEELGMRNNSRVKQCAGGMALASLAIIIRGFYRTAELSQNFSGAIATNQMLFFLDGIPVSIAMWTLNLFHPSRLITPIIEERNATRERPDSPETAVNPDASIPLKERKVVE